MNRIAIFVLSVLCLAFPSCLDMLEPSPTVFVGKIYLQHSQGFTFLIYTKADISQGGYTAETIIRENVALALGNDSIIYVKSTDRKASIYYWVRHDKGEKVLAVKETDSLNFFRAIKGEKFTYTYTDRSM